MSEGDKQWPSASGSFSRGGWRRKNPTCQRAMIPCRASGKPDVLWSMLRGCGSSISTVRRVILTQLAQLPENATRTLGTDVEVIRRFRQQIEVTAPTTSPTRVVEIEHNTLRLFLVLTRATIALAQSRPTVLILDDLHWADRSSLDLFRYLLKTAG